MATEKEANKAREEHSDYLTALGAHAILVDQIKRGGSKTFAVIAFCEREPAKPVPAELEIKSGGKKKKIPLAVRITPMAKLE
jgi:hypothetical protein